jgi:hypothetical protein
MYEILPAPVELSEDKSVISKGILPVKPVLPNARAVTWSLTHVTPCQLPLQGSIVKLSQLVLTLQPGGDATGGFKAKVHRLPMPLVAKKILANAKYCTALAKVKLSAFGRD